MHTFAPKTPTTAAVNDRPLARSDADTLRLTDNRPHTAQLKALQAMADNGCRTPLPQTVAAPTDSAAPVQRRMRSGVERDDLTNYQDESDGEEDRIIAPVAAVPADIKAEFGEIVTGAVNAIYQTVPELEELLDLVAANWMDIDILLANRPGPASTAGGQTINGQYLGIDVPFAADASGLIDVAHLTAPPVKSLLIKVYKQDIDPRGPDVTSRYRIKNSAQIYQVVMHELLMHAVPHMRHMRNREALRDEQRIPSVNTNDPGATKALKDANIPALETSKRAIGAAAKHEDPELWRKQLDVVQQYVPDGRVTKAEFAIHVIDDLFEHIGQNGLNEDVRDTLLDLVHDLLETPGVGDDIAVIKSAINNMQFQIEDTANGKDHEYFGNPPHLVTMVEGSLTDLKGRLDAQLVALSDTARARIFLEYQTYQAHRLDDPQQHAERLRDLKYALEALGDTTREYLEVRGAHEIAASAIEEESIYDY